MIIFESGIKNLILVVLVVCFLGIIVWQWASRNPFSQIQGVNTSLLAEVADETGDSFEDIQNSFSEGKENLAILNEEIAKQAKQEQLVEETKKYLENKENNLIQAPTNKEDCDLKEGDWNEESLKCFVQTDDAGKECNSSSDCQGYCSADLATIYDKFITDNKVVEISGFCSENVFKYGCLALVEDGLVSEIVCLD